MIELSQKYLIIITLSFPALPFVVRNIGKYVILYKVNKEHSFQTLLTFPAKCSGYNDCIFAVRILRKVHICEDLYESTITLIDVKSLV